VQRPVSYLQFGLLHVSPVGQSAVVVQTVLRDQLARSELREQLRADLLKSLVVNYAGGRQYSGGAAIDLYAYLNSDICRCGRHTCWRSSCR